MSIDFDDASTGFADRVSFDAPTTATYPLIDFDQEGIGFDDDFELIDRTPSTS